MFISTLKTWNDARNYCRKYYTDLPIIENNEENDEVSSAIEATYITWIGLYRVRWSWSDKSQSSFRFWRSGSPNNIGGNQLCMSENQRHEWDDDGCHFKIPFICHQGDCSTTQINSFNFNQTKCLFCDCCSVYCPVSKLKTTLRMKIETDADLTDPATNTQILQQGQLFIFLCFLKMKNDRG